jgi:hypothetical protein
VLTLRRVAMLVALAAGVLGLASCDGQSSASPAPQDGTVVGVFGISGGPAPGGFGPFSSGTVTLRNAGHVYSALITHDGRFKIRVLPGTYDVTGYGPQGNACINNPVAVHARKTTSVTVACEVP